MTIKRKKSHIPNYNYPFPDDGGMHNPNINFVCFKCKFVRRESGILENAELWTCVCPHCHQKMTNAFCKDEIPRKTNDRGWKLLEKKHK